MGDGFYIGQPAITKTYARGGRIETQMPATHINCITYYQK